MSSATYETVETDVLVIGAGGAGLRAAIAAGESGARVLVVCKSLLGKAHTVMAEGGVAAAMHNVAYQDSWEVHFADTMKGGKLINDWRAAELHARESPERVLELELWGAVFDRTWQGRIHQRPFGAHTFPRLAHIGDRTGLELIRTLQDRAVHTKNVDVHMETTVFKLLKSDGRISGALAYRRADGSLILFRCAALVLASGGAGKMYRVTSNSWESTGDGTALAYDAGAELRDMEMVQFHPTGMVWPAGVRGILVTEGVRGEGGVLRNKDGQRFMESYDRERMELSSRDIVARAINSEVAAGRGTPHGGAFLDITHRKPDYIKAKLPSMYEQFLKLANVDITRQAMEVAPTIHYAMGGVRVDAETCAASVPGLHAAGEVASGLHGANRLGGNSLSDLLVFGKRAGEAAAASSKAKSGVVDEAVDSGRDRRADGAARARCRREPLQAHGRDPGRDERARSDRSRWRNAPGRAGEDRGSAREGGGMRHRRIGHPRVQPGLAHRLRPAVDARQRGGSAAIRARAQGESRRSREVGFSEDRRRARAGELHRPQDRLRHAGARRADPADA